MPSRVPRARADRRARCLKAGALSVGDRVRGNTLSHRFRQLGPHEEPALVPLLNRICSHARFCLQTVLPGC
jgi:hypothetical protein